MAAIIGVAVVILARQGLFDTRLASPFFKMFHPDLGWLYAGLVLLVLVGSSNLDARSLNLNYELMLRLQGAEVASVARALFEQALRHARRITSEDWRRSRTFWARLKQRWAYFLLARVDPWIAARQWRALPD